MLRPTDLVKVRVIDDNYVEAVVNGVVHSANFSDVEPGEFAEFTNLKGNASLLNAALYAWCGQEEFTATVQELDNCSGGWGIK